MPDLPAAIASAELSSTLASGTTACSPWNVRSRDGLRACTLDSSDDGGDRVFFFQTDDPLTSEPPAGADRAARSTAAAKEPEGGAPLAGESPTPCLVNSSFTRPMLRSRFASGAAEAVRELGTPGSPGDDERRCLSPRVEPTPGPADAARALMLTGVTPSLPDPTPSAGDTGTRVPSSAWW